MIDLRKRVRAQVAKDLASFASEMRHYLSGRLMKRRLLQLQTRRGIGTSASLDGMGE